jgi:hypothetical protein
MNPKLQATIPSRANRQNITLCPKAITDKLMNSHEVIPNENLDALLLCPLC